MTIAAQRPPRPAHPLRPAAGARSAAANGRAAPTDPPPNDATPHGATRARRRAPRPAADGTGDPIDALVDRVRPALAHAVDPLQVTARLEADGVTDRAARVEYGMDDVFDLAGEVFHRLAPGPPPAPPPAPVVPAWRSGARDASHGLLYLLPGALFPAALAALGRGPLVTALVLTGGLGWAWSGGASWLAYRRLGAGDPAGAARALCWSVLLGLPASALLGAVIAAAGPPGPGAGLVGLCLGQMAYQLASMLLVFYRREELLAAALVPAALAGCGYLLYGGGAWWTAVPARPDRAWTMPAALTLGAAAVLVALALGVREAARRTGWSWRTAGRTAGKVGAGAWAGVRADLPGLAWATAYAALSAAYLLRAQAPYLTDRLDVALTAAPLMAGMGVVEWRARRYGELARHALARVRHPREFAARVAGLLAGGVGISAGVVAALAVPLLVGLDRAGALSPAGVLMAGAHATLAGAYFLSFLLAAQGRYPALCGALVVAVGAHAAGGHLAGGGPGGPTADPVADTALFLGSAVLLLVLWAVLLARAAAQAWRYR
jgi:hypothetical protein